MKLVPFKSAADELPVFLDVQQYGDAVKLSVVDRDGKWLQTILTLTASGIERHPLSNDFLTKHKFAVIDERLVRIVR